jgi:hypothetical protein
MYRYAGKGVHPCTPISKPPLPKIIKITFTPQKMGSAMHDWKTFAIYVVLIVPWGDSNTFKS